MRETMFIVLLVVLLASCGGDDAVVKPPVDPAIPVVHYAPTPGEIVLEALDTLVLAVSVSPDQPFSVAYTRDDSILVGEQAELVVVGDRLGVRTYEADVQVGKYRYDDDWTVRVVAELELPTPSPSSAVAGPGSLPGTVGIEWDRPPDFLIEIPLSGFEVAWSTAPFTREEFDLNEIAFVPDRPIGIRQRAEIPGLEQGRRYYLRVRSLDQLDRRSYPTDEVEAPATGSFELSGVVAQLDPTGWPTGVGSVLVEVGPVRQTTLEDGLFSLGGIPDREPLPVRVVEGSGDFTLSILTTPLEPVTREVQYILIPKQNVSYRDMDGLVLDVPLVDFALEALRRDNGVPPYAFHPWPRYPVPVYVWEYQGTYDGPAGEAPLYHEAYATAIDRWNDGATGDRQLLEYVAVDDSLFDITTQPDPYGVSVRLYPGTSQNFGEVDFLIPSGGAIGEDDPQVMRLRLRRGMPKDLLERVLTHELGHVLGLSHVGSYSALMHATSALAEGIPTDAERFTVNFLRHGGPDLQSNWIEQP